MSAIASIDIKDAGPFDTFHLEPRVVALIEGPNGSGKSTLLNCITSAFENSHDASIIREGRDKAEIVITLDDGTKIRRTVTAKGTYGDCTTADGRKVPRVESYLKSLASGMTLDPIRLANCSKKERLEFVLKNAALVFQPAEIRAITGTNPTGVYNLDDLDALIEGIAEKRADAKKNVQENESTLKKLSETIEDGDGKDWAAIQAQAEARAESTKANLNTRIEAAKTDRFEKMATIQKALNEEIDAIRARAEKEIREATSTAETAKEDVRSAEAKSIAAAKDELQPMLDDLNQQISAAREKAAAQQRLQGVRDTITQIEGRIRSLSQEASKHQEAIEELRKLRKAKLDSLPIPGIEIRNGDIYCNGKSFTDQLNEAERHLLAFQICAEFREPGSLPVFICDAGSSFDDKNLKYLSDACKDLGMQLLITRVSNQEALTVSTV